MAGANFFAAAALAGVPFFSCTTTIATPAFSALAASARGERAAFLRMNSLVFDALFFDLDIFGGSSRTALYADSRRRGGD